MWLRRCFSQEFQASFSRESKLMKLSEISRAVAHLRVNQSAPAVMSAALETATREFRLLDQRLRTKDGMNSCRYLLNEIRLLECDKPPLLQTLTPIMHHCAPDLKVLSFGYFMLRKAGCRSEEFFMWAEELLLAETANASVSKLKDLLQVLSGISCIQGPLSALQKQILAHIDKILCTHSQQLNKQDIYCSAMHSFAKAGFLSTNLKQQLEDRLHPIIYQVAKYPDKAMLGVICSSACRIKLNSPLIRSAIFPAVVRNLYSIPEKHLINLLFYMAEPDIFDRNLFERIQKAISTNVPNRHLNDMLQNAKQRAREL
jgi:hypothetical protein